MYTGIFHINNTLLAYIIPGFLMSAMNVMLIRTFFATSIPDALFEAAQIDGASQLQIFLKVVLPLGKPILVAMGLLSVLDTGMTGPMVCIISAIRSYTESRTC